MNLPENFNTSIDELLDSSRSDTIFLSTWDKKIHKSDVPLKIITKSTHITLNDINKYQYMDEMRQVKSYISNSICLNEKMLISPDNFAVATNGTASSYLILKTLSQNAKIYQLILTPIYFSYILSLKEFCENIEFFQVFQDSNLNINFSKLEDIISKNHINLVIINDPIFGCGISIKNETYKKFIYLCKKYYVTLIVDYIYGGMNWNEERHYIHKYLLEQINSCENVIIIDSMSKRLFINGIKNAIIYGSSSVIKRIEKESVHTLGCMVYSQISLLKELYSPYNKETINKLINNNISHSKNNYDFIKSLVLGTNCYLENCDSGFYSLFKIPYRILGTNSNMQIAKMILKKCNVLTIPHERYLYFNTYEYCFRINLLSSKINLAQGINAIIDNFC